MAKRSIRQKQWLLIEAAEGRISITKAASYKEVFDAMRNYFRSCDFDIKCYPGEGSCWINRRAAYVDSPVDGWERSWRVAEIQEIIANSIISADKKAKHWLLIEASQGEISVTSQPSYKEAYEAMRNYFRSCDFDPKSYPGEGSHLINKRAAYIDSPADGWERFWRIVEIEEINAIPLNQTI